MPTKGINLGRENPMPAAKKFAMPKLHLVTVELRIDDLPTLPSFHPCNAELLAIPATGNVIEVHDWLHEDDKQMIRNKTGREPKDYFYGDAITFHVKEGGVLHTTDDDGNPKLVVELVPQVPNF